MIEAIYRNDVCKFTQTENAERCDFLQFLKRTSMIEPCGSEMNTETMCICLVSCAQ